MSLLMDALKRAEKARQAQTSDAGEAPRDPADTQGLTLDPLEMSSPRVPPDARAASTDDAVDSPAEAASRPEPPTGGGLSMEPLDERTEALGPDPREGSGPRARPGDTGGDSEPGGSGGFSLLEDIDIDDTAATLPSLKAAQASVDDYFDGTRSVSMSMEQPELDIEAGADTITAERAAVHPDRSAARAVFDAKAPARRRRRNWASAGFLTLVLLALLSGGVFMYWNELGELVGARPNVVTTRQPMVTVTPAPAAPAPVPAAPPTAASTARFPSPSPGQPDTVTGLTMAEPADAQMQGAVNIGDPAGAEVLTAPSVAEVLDTAPRASARAARPVPAAPVASAPARPESVPAAVAALPLGLQPGLLQDGRLASGSLQISRRSKPARVSPLLERGYRAYRSGDDAAARSAYQKVLAAEPNNRDAALGLAAVSMRAGQWNSAHDLYMRVLSRNPRDSLAMTGLLALTDNVDPIAAESRVNTLLAAEPGAAHLHFALGNLYARQERWPEAQGAYFEAYRLDDENADYAFNLAVSLDRLVQRKTALEYYRLALDLATRRPASFDSTSVSERIRMMTAAGES